MKVKVLVMQLCPTLWDPMDCSLPDSSVLGICQARILQWVAIPFPGYLPNPGIEYRALELQANSLPSEPPGKPKYKLPNAIKKILDSEKLHSSSFHF